MSEGRWGRVLALALGMSLLASREAPARPHRPAPAAAAASVELDAWRAVDDALSRGHRGEAGARALAYVLSPAGRVDGGALLRFAQRGVGAGLPALHRLAEIRADAPTVPPATTAAALERLEVPVRSPAAVDAQLLRAHALRRTGPEPAALAAATEAERRATELGWARGTADALGLLGALHALAARLGPATAAWDAQADLLLRLGDVAAALRTEADVALAHARVGDDRTAVLRFGRVVRDEVALSAAHRATVHIRRAGSLRRLGDFVGAFADLAVALEGLDPTKAPSAAIEGEAALATLYGAIGDADGEAAAAQRAADHAARAERLGWLSPTTAARHRALAEGGLAVVALKRSRYDKAAQRLQSARATLAQLNEPTLVARVDQVLGEVHLRAGRHQAALDVSTAAAGALRERGDVTSALLAEGNAAEAARALKLPDAAQQAREVLLEARRRGLASIALEQAVRIARADRDAGRDDEALSTVEEAAEWTRTLFGPLADADRVGARATYADLFDVGLEIGLLRRDLPLAFRYLELARAASLLDAFGHSEALRSVHTSPDAVEARRRAALRYEEARQAAFSSDGTLTAQNRLLDDAFRSYAEDLRAIERSYRAESPDLLPAPDDVVTTQRRLRADEALVLYARVPARSLATAIVLTPTDARLVDLDARAVATALELNGWYLRGATPVAAQLAAASRDLRSLAAALWAPIEAVLPADVRHVYVVPDGDVARVPLARAAGRARSMRYVPSASVLGELLRRNRVDGRDVLAIGVSSAPGGGSTGGRLLAKRFGLGPAPAAGPAARALSKYALVDEETTEDAVRAAMASTHWRTVAFGCHAWVSGTTPTLCALALFGGPGEDGFLTALEVCTASCRADLVVLSACNSGTGRVVPGEGMVGLVRAFLLAGAERVVATLWPVLDEPAAAYTHTLVKTWQTGTFLDPSMQAATDAIHTPTSPAPPESWAAWVSWGLR